jgi:hypothetical protein
LIANTNGSGNIAIGLNSLSFQKFDNGGGVPWVTANVAIGQEALELNNPTTNANGINNTAIGYNTAKYNSTGHENTAVGSVALFSNQTGFSNTVVGYGALHNNSSGSLNTAMGQGALYTNDGNDNTAFGYSALSNNTVGFQNTAVGEGSLNNNTLGTENNSLGYNSLYSNTVASSNVAVGHNALANQSYTNNNLYYTGGNVAIGAGALYFNNPASTVTGVYNTAVGYQSLSVNVLGSGNVAIGYNAGPQTGFSNLSNTTCIGNGAASNANNQMVLGNVNVTQFYCYGAFAGTTANAPNLYVMNTGQIMRMTSSRRYKKDIVPLEINTASIYQLRPVSYNSISDNDRHFGLIAEEVAEVIPELASFAREKDVIKGSSSEKMIPDAVQYPLLSVLLLKEVQQHQQTITELKDTITEMKKMLAAQQAQIDALKK